MRNNLVDDIKLALESIVVGLVAQITVGWISPFTPLLAGFVSGVVVGKEKDGTMTGAVVGAITGITFIIRVHFNLALLYIYPTASFLSRTGAMGVYIVAFGMIFAGLLGGKVGGSLMSRAVSRSYLRGENFGEMKHLNFEQGLPKRARKSR